MDRIICNTTFVKPMFEAYVYASAADIIIRGRRAKLRRD